MPDPALNPDFDTELDAALRRAPGVRVPEHFSQRLFARLPASHAPAAPRSSLWVLPALALAGAATLAALGVAAVDLGWTVWINQPPVLLTVLGMEAVVSLAWVWRTFRSAR
jgi:hypothetical protein